MASREKRPLAPSKTKQKTNNDTVLPSTETKSKGKAKSQGNARQQQLAKEILDAVATGSQLPTKLNAGLPRKKALKTLKRKQKLKGAKASLIKAKISKKAPIRAIRKVTAETKKTAKAKRVRKLETEPEQGLATVKEDTENLEALNKGKNFLKNKRAKPLSKANEGETETIDKNPDLVSISKQSPKIAKKLKNVGKKFTNEQEVTEDSKVTELDFKTVESISRSGKTTKTISVKRKDSEIQARSPEDIKDLVVARGGKGKRNTSKERESISRGKNSIDLTIDEVIASSMQDPEDVNLQKDPEKTRKAKKGKKLILVEDDIKKELDPEGTDQLPDELDMEYDSSIQTPVEVAAIQKNQSGLESPRTLARSRLNCTQTQRSLRNGKLRKLSDSEIVSDLETRRRRRLNSEDPTRSDICTGDFSDEVMEGDSCFYDLDTSQGTTSLSRSDHLLHGEVMGLKNYEEDIQNGGEIVDNNNGERGDRTGDVGPTLRSKTKARSAGTGSPGLEDDSKEDARASLKAEELLEDLEKSSNTEQARKDSTLGKVAEKPRSSKSGSTHEYPKAEDGKSCTKTLELQEDSIKSSNVHQDKKDISLEKVSEIPKNNKGKITPEDDSNVDDGRSSSITMELQDDSKKSTLPEQIRKDNSLGKTSEKASEVQEDLKKSMALEQSRRDSSFVKVSEKSSSRRSSLNLDVKKTVGSFYGNEKPDNGTKSQIDQMIENIKLNIAKSIESKIFGPEKNLTLNKNFEVSKIEEVVAPLSTESQKTVLEDVVAQDNKPNFSKKDVVTTDCSENSVPKVGDTAKEIEKLVMGDLEDTRNTNSVNDLMKVFEFEEVEGVNSDSRSFPRSRKSEDNIGNCSSKIESDQDPVSLETHGVKEDLVQVVDNQESSKKTTSIRKSSRILDKSTNISQKPSERKEIPLTGSGELSETVEGIASSQDTSEQDTNVSVDHSLEDVLKSTDNKESAEAFGPLDEASSSAVTRGKADNTSRNMEVSTDDRNSETDFCLNVSIRSEESETLESISREVERLVAEGESGPGKCQVKSMASPEKRETRSHSGTCSENPSQGVKTSYEDFNDIVDTESESNRFLEALESSFTDSEILNMAPEITEVLATKDLPQDSVCPRNDLDFNKFVEVSGEAAQGSENEVPSCKNADDISNNQGTIVSNEKSSSNTQSLLEALETSNEDSDKDMITEEPSLEQILSSEEQSVDCEEVQETVKTTVKVLEKTEETKENIFSVGKSTVQQQSETSDSIIETITEQQSSNDAKDKKLNSEEQKLLTEENKRVLRARDKQKKIDTKQKFEESDKIEVDTQTIVDNVQTSPSVDLEIPVGSFEDKTDQDNFLNPLKSDDKQLAIMEDIHPEPQIRTRRSREVKKRKDDLQQIRDNVPRSKRTKRDSRKTDQQNKEETLLDNEVAKINENNQSLSQKYEKNLEEGDSFRGFSEGASSQAAHQVENDQNNQDNPRSKSENDLANVRNDSRNDALSGCSRKVSVPIEKAQKEVDHPEGCLDNEAARKTLEQDLKTPETSQKDSDELSSSGESSSSLGTTPKILETPEDRAKKESILRLLGLESLEKAAERMNHQKARKEQSTGTLKTVIRVQKEKDKKRSRSPLKMVLKQGRSDGDGDSPEFYTIQKEFGTSGLGDSSSGANRKFPTNHRHSCDEDNEEVPPKDRQSLVIPEKSSSFSIHPGRLCADVCCYCFGKFGSLDTPMHLAQMKSDERRKKILNIERHLTKDSCLCDACYRHVDRKANTSPTNMQSKPPRQHRQLMVSKCTARDCREPARHHVKRRWLLKIKTGLQNQVDIDWESSQHTSMSFCVEHYSKIERFLTCALCKRRLARNHTHQLVAAETDELNQRLRQQGIPVPLAAGTFVCKLCRYFTQLQLKYKDIENMNANHKSFFKSYRKRILHYHDIDVLENEEEDSSSQGQPTKDKEKRKKSKCGPSKSSGSKFIDGATNSTSEKSTPEPNKNEGTNSETDNDSFVTRNLKTNPREGPGTDIQILSMDDNLENLKKRKSIDSNNTLKVNPGISGHSDLVNILTMDKEVTLTRLPKRARTTNDISPVVQRLGANPSISVRTLFPGEEEMNLQANVEFGNVREVTPQGWEKCATMIQYDRDTKLLWQELQRPYGNQSSFLRHLILLEKYYRSGDLVLAPNASRNAINYSTSVQNRLISYEGPEKVDEPILEPMSSEFANPHRLSGGFLMERDRLSLPSTSSLRSPGSLGSGGIGPINIIPKSSPPSMMKLNPRVSIIKKPPPSLHRLSLPSTSTNGNLKRKDTRLPAMSGGKVFQLSEPEFKRLQNLKRQKMMGDKQPPASSSGSTGNTTATTTSGKPTTQYQKAQIAAQFQFQKHLRMQQEMLSRQSRSDFEPLICDVRSLANENNPAQNLINNLNLPKSIQVTTKPGTAISMMPKIPKSLTVIPQTVTRPTDK